MPPQIPLAQQPIGRIIKPQQPQPLQQGSTFGDTLSRLGNWINQAGQRGQQLVQQGGPGLGQRAKMPDANVTPLSTTLPPNQVSTPVPSTIKPSTWSGQNFPSPIARDTQGTPLPPNYQPFTGTQTSQLKSSEVNVQPPDQPTTPPQINMQGQAVPQGISDPNWKGGWVGGQWIPAGQSPGQIGSPNFQPTGGLYGQLITNAANMAAGGSPGVQQAIQNLQQFQKGLAQQYAGIEQTPIPLEFQQGREQVVARQAVGEQAALQTALQNQLSQQQLGQQGLLSAAGLAAPQPYGITTTPYQPVTGQFGTMPGGAGGAFGAGEKLGQLGFGQQYTQTLLPAFNAAKKYENTISDYIDKNPDLNATPSTFLNSLDQWFRGGQLGDSRYQTFIDYITEYTNTLAPILGAGGAISNFKTQLSQSLVNGAAPRDAIKQVLANIGQAAQNKLQSMVSGAMGQEVTPSQQPQQPTNNTQPQSTGTVFTPGNFFSR